MIDLINKDKCCGCAACVNVCPKAAISMKEDEEGFYYPEVNKELCIECGLCQKACAFDVHTSNTNEPTAYAAVCHNTELRINSSSGGIFTLLAENVLDKEGAVYGVSMSNDCRSCSHIKVIDKNDLNKIRGSKYFQARPMTLYEDIREELSSGKTVLFSGTGCQVNALKNYLGKDYSNLIAVDVICHGCPSPKLWEKYVDDTEQKYGEKIEQVNFRHKKKGWKNFGIFHKMESKEIYISKDKDSFMQMFLRNYCLRPSCYNCTSKYSKMSDITLGDFWGLNDVLPEINDNRGVSLVLVRTHNGALAFEEIREKMKAFEVPYKDSVKKNSAEYESVSRPAQRESFFEDMLKMDYNKLSKKYIKPNYKKDIKRLLVNTGLWKIYAFFRKAD